MAGPKSSPSVLPLSSRRPSSWAGCPFGHGRSSSSLTLLRRAARRHGDRPRWCHRWSRFSIWQWDPWIRQLTEWPGARRSPTGSSRSWWPSSSFVMFVRRPRRSVVDGEVVEVREPGNARPGCGLRRPRSAVPRRQLVPRTASEAYVASIELLARRPESGRGMLPRRPPSMPAGFAPTQSARRLVVSPRITRWPNSGSGLLGTVRTSPRRSSVGDVSVRPEGGQPRIARQRNGGDGGESNSPSRTLLRRPLRACPMIYRRPPERASAPCRTVQSRAPRSGFTPDYVTLVRIASSLDDASTTHEEEAASTLTLLPKQRERESTGGCQVLLFAT